MLYSHLTEKIGEAQSCQNRTIKYNTLSIFIIAERPLYCARLNWRVPVWRSFFV